MMAGSWALYHAVVKCSDVAKEHHALIFSFYEFKWTLKLCFDFSEEGVLSLFRIAIKI